MKARVTLKSVLLVQLVFSFLCVQAQQQLKRTNTPRAIPYLEHLPEGYSAPANSAKTYPLLIFLHGTGEKGSGSDQQAWKVAKNGPPQHIQRGHDMTFEVNGQSHSFIVISPQLLYSAGNWPSDYIEEVVKYARQQYRIDNTRIYLTGLSLGGGGAWRFGGEHADLFAAIAPICGAQSVMYDKVRNMNNHDLPVWAFHGDADGTIPVTKTQGWINALNDHEVSPAAQITVYPGVGHNAWSRAYDPSHTYHQPNLYEWLLSHTRNGVAPAPPAPAPAPAPEPSASVEDDCGCDYVVPAGQHVTDGQALGIQPGDVICLDSDVDYNNLKFININGTAGQPVVIKNCGGKVTINTSATFAIKTNTSRHFRITGSGDSSYEYGIELRGATSLGLTLDMLSTDFEVDHLEVHNIGFAGIMAKTDPSCGKPYNRDQFTMQNIKIHDNYVHDTRGEGLYVGNSFYAKGKSASCGTLLPHAVRNAKIYNNVVKRTGWDGIQIGSATEGCEVYNNTVEDYGQRQNSVHGNGIQLGEGTGGTCYNNVIKNGYGAGIIALGWGDNVIFNNLIVNPGSFGTFIDSRPPASPGDGFKFLNNTIINAPSDGVRIYAKDANLRNLVKNNLIVAQGDYVKLLHSGITNTSVSNNFEARKLSEVGFMNADKNDYHLTPASPCVNRGVDLSAYGVTFDIENVARPKGGAFDIGACESIGAKTPAPAPSPAPAPAPTDDTAQGLNYSYYQGTWDNLPDFGSLVAVKTGTVTNFSLSPRTTDQLFGFAFEGYIDITTAGTYTFYTTSDDGSQLYIDDQRVVDNDGLHGPRERSGSITLAKGKHPIRVVFFEKTGGQKLEVRYAGPGIEKALIPNQILSHEDGTVSPAPDPAPTAPTPTVEEGPIRYRYYEGAWDVLPDFQSLTPKATGYVNSISLDVRQRDSNFGVVYESYIRIPVSGSYTFSLKSDDGSKLYIGGLSEDKVMVSHDGQHSAYFKHNTVSLEAGTYPVAVTFFEREGQEVLEVYWSNTAHGVTERTLIPNEAFVYPTDKSSVDHDRQVPAPSTSSVLVNFGNDRSRAAAPWNNLIGTQAGTKVSNLQDQQGNNSKLSVSLLDTWGGSKSQSITGATAYPKTVTGSYHWDASPHQKRIKIAGMNPASVYSITFFASRVGSGNKTTVFTINGNAVSLNAANNLSDTVFVNQVVPNAQGEVVIGVQKADGAGFAYFNALIIRDTGSSGARTSRHHKAVSTTEDNASDLGVTVDCYPNPMADQLTVDLLLAPDTQNVRLQLSDLLGNVVATSLVATASSGQVTTALDGLSHLKSGIYALSVYFNQTHQRTVRLIKE